jgi:hypothetical protein
VKLTPTVQVPPAETLAPEQVSLITLKLAAGVRVTAPNTAGYESPPAKVPLALGLVKVMVRGVDVVPADTWPKLMEAGAAVGVEIFTAAT